MEEEGEVADQAGGTRRRRRAGDRASVVADGDDTPGAAGDGGNGAAADDDNDNRDDPDERYPWGSQTLSSAFLLWAKARHFTHPPAWLSGARREAGAGGELHRQAARLYESLSALALALEVAIMIVLCLFRLTLVPAGRARAALRVFMVVSLACSLTSLVVASMAGSADAAAAFLTLLTVLPSAVVAVQFALKKLKEVLAKMVAELNQGEVDG